MRPRTASRAATGTVAALLLLSACATRPDEPGATTGSATGDTTETTTAEATTDTAACAGSDLDLAETSFGRYTPLRVVDTGVSNVWFNFEIVDNRFDPCLPLSWVTLSGTNGDRSQPEGGPATIAEAVVFFHHDTPVTDPPPVQFREIRAVERAADDTVEVTYGHAGGANADGVTETFTVTHTWDDTRMVTGGPDATAYEEAASFLLTLNLNSLPPPHDAPSVLLGNAGDSRLAAQHSLRRRTEALIATMPLDNAWMTCSFASPAAPISCRGEGVSWPVIPEGFTERTSWQGPGPASGLGIGYLPTTVSTTGDPSPMPDPEVELPDEALSRVGTYLVDTSGDTVVISSGRSGVEVGKVGIRLTEVSHVDTSRW
ncbi:LppP/LprE family lipoprotein [Corynebacterium halotolerans]|uniref:Uncharacterized protein n=1 Tax=Corynebacterium halotolerans YIM 70093 = DSM 44683 TaxID=1121362 RepID=M1MU25_9CORY|nr:LppP/LprE family lipoprotein [Corynebacterium halotolerans]AGF71214.1 hypothetical protein A605_00990 [Corynebacterium halotolerans YIM 70093 = DSM 44683]